MLVGHTGARKGALSASVVSLAAGSFATALADDIVVMIVGRCLQGIGIGGVTEIIVTEMVPLRFRSQVACIDQYCMASWDSDWASCRRFACRLLSPSLG